MKTILAMISIVTLAVGLTAAYSFWQFNSSQSTVPSAKPLDSPSAERTMPGEKARHEIVGDQKPVAVVDKPLHDFVRARNKTSDRHVFVIRNTGSAPLEVTKAVASCPLCVFIDSLPEAIPPGESGEIAIRWKIDMVDDTFRRSVTLNTTDLDHPEIVLTITGKVLQPLQVTPRELVLSKVISGEPATVKVRLDAFFSDDLQVGQPELLDQETAAFFDVETVRLETADLAPHAQSGFDLVVTVKPGLPLGGFKQKIRISTNAEDNPEVTIPIEGLVTGDASVIGGKLWDAKRGVLHLGGIERNKGAKESVKLLVRGPHQKGLVLGTPRISPDWLVVSCSELIPVEGDNLSQATITVEVPPGAPTGDHSGSLDDSKPGEIVIPTNRPELGEIRLQVNFAVAEN